MGCPILFKKARLRLNEKYDKSLDLSVVKTNFQTVLQITGWVLSSKDDPSEILKRSQTPSIEPQFQDEYFSHHLAEIDDLSTLLQVAP
jgi:hypothetical protein